MNLKDILAISGEPGLFKFIAQGKNAIIVEHLETKKRSSAYGSAKVSSLEDIAIFTNTEDVPLGKVFDLIHEKSNGGAAIDAKSDNNALKNWFGEILPEFSKDKVYVSDIRKVAQWYNILHKLNLLVKDEPEVASEEVKEEPAAEAPKKAKKAPAKPKADKKK
jgi:recombination DNA repair RAD52 pathway protein